MAKKKKPETLDLLGKLLDGLPEQARDCVHIAVMPVFAGERLTRGDKLKLAFGTADLVLEATYDDDNYIGIADPFLSDADCRIGEGQKFWMYIRPGTINGLKHSWTHDAIDAPGPVCSAPELWLRRFAEKWNFDYSEMINGAKEKDGYVTARGRDLHGRGELDPGDEEAFWQNIELLTGGEFNEDHRKAFGWSCSC